MFKRFNKKTEKSTYNLKIEEILKIVNDHLPSLTYLGDRLYYLIICGRMVGLRQDLQQKYSLQELNEFLGETEDERIYEKVKSLLKKIWDWDDKKSEEVLRRLCSILYSEEQDSSFYSDLRERMSKLFIDEAQK